MPRKSFKRREPEPDPVYGDKLVGKLINIVMREGKKTKAMKIVYTAFDIIRQKTNQDPLEVFYQAVENTKPEMEVRARRVGGATYQVPFPVKSHRKISLALRWIVKAARSKSGRPMAERLAQEIMDAANNTGEAVRTKENLQKVAEANRAFSHLAW